MMALPFPEELWSYKNMNDSKHGQLVFQIQCPHPGLLGFATTGDRTPLTVRSRTSAIQLNGFDHLLTCQIFQHHLYHHRAGIELPGQANRGERTTLLK